jgi:preprotein translocase subunit SecG
MGLRYFYNIQKQPMVKVTLILIQIFISGSLQLQLLQNYEVENCEQKTIRKKLTTQKRRQNHMRGSCYLFSQSKTNQFFIL